MASRNSCVLFRTGHCLYSGPLMTPPVRTLGLIIALALALAVPARAAPGETVTIGFTVSQTGNLNVDSVAQRNGFDLWRDDVNRQGGLMAGGKIYKIEFACYDDQSRATRVQYSAHLSRSRRLPVQPLLLGANRERSRYLRTVPQGDADDGSRRGRHL